MQIDWAIGYSLALLHLIPSWLSWAEIECAAHVALPKQAMHQFNPVQQSRQLGTYCPNIYTVVSLEKIFSEEKSFMNLCGIDKRSLKIPWE